MIKLIAEIVGKLVGMAVVAALLVTGASMIGAFPVKWAWNASMPGIFGLKSIGFWEAFSLIWLSGALVKASANASANADKKKPD